MMKNKELPYTPIVALTGDDKDKLSLMNLEDNFDGIRNSTYNYIVQKPVDVKILKKVLNDFIFRN